MRQFSCLLKSLVPAFLKEHYKILANLIKVWHVHPMANLWERDKAPGSPNPRMTTTKTSTMSLSPVLFRPYPKNLGTYIRFDEREKGSYLSFILSKWKISLLYLLLMSYSAIILWYILIFFPPLSLFSFSIFSFKKRDIAADVYGLTIFLVIFAIRRQRVRMWIFSSVWISDFFTFRWNNYPSWVIPLMY